MKLVDICTLSNNINTQEGISDSMLAILRIGGCQYISDSRHILQDIYLHSLKTKNAA